MKNSIETKNLHRSYGDFFLDISMLLKEGNILGLIGENGAGKSTFIKLILGLIHRDGGDYKILGVGNVDEHREIFEDIGVVIDDNALPEYLNIDQINNIMKDLYSSWDEEKYYTLVHKLKLDREKKLKEFSKGMKMKISLIVAFSHNPKLLILDEPTTGLDPVVRQQILDMFLDFVQDESHSILFSSHIMDDLEKIADYIIFIKDGEVIFNEEKDRIIYDWGVIRGDKSILNKVEKENLIAYRANSYGYDILIDNKEYAKETLYNEIVDPATLNETMLICSSESVKEGN